MAIRLHVRGAREAALFSELPGSAIRARPTQLVAGDDAFVLVRGWLAHERADSLLHEISTTTQWAHERRVMYDRTIEVPREQAWVGAGYERPMWPGLARVRDDLETLAGARFGFVLFNRYRDGTDSVAWHSDRADSHGDLPGVVASLTLGATRPFEVRPKAARSQVVSVDLDHGDLVLMTAGAQLAYEHRVPKLRRNPGVRINLTFRPKRPPEQRIEQEFERPSPIDFET